MSVYENRTVILSLRVLQLLFAIIVIGTSGYVAHWFTDFISDSPSQINFMIFCAVWTILAAIYLLIATLKFTDSIIGHGFILLAVDAITMIFWFAGFIALAVGVGGLSCNGNSVCGSADASAAFGAFEWLLFLITTVLAAMHVWGKHGSGISRKPNTTTQTAQVGV